MAITWTRDPFFGLRNIHRDLDDVFTGLLSGSSVSDDNVPAMDIYDRDGKEIVAEVQLPGFSPEDVEIRITDNVLEVRGQHSQEIEDEQERSYMLRQSVSSFVRAITLPQNVDKDALEAEFDDNGILKIRMPYEKEAAPKTITVTAGKRSKGKQSK